MTNKSVGREVLVERVRRELGLKTQKDAVFITNAVLGELLELLKENLDEDGFTVKVPLLGKFSVRHVPSRQRKNPFKDGVVMTTRPKRQVRFLALGELRELETKK